MKNIHILPTDKPSRLWMTKLGNLTRCHDIRVIKEALGNNVNIYINDDSEIKKEDWFIQVNTKKIIKHHSKNGLLLQPQKFDKKIILTTDQDLIKDGVQPIDDDFLEWFVKNPSCEFVEVKHKDIIQYGNMTMHDHNGDGSYYFCTNCEVETSRSKEELLKFGVEYYKIIIPNLETLEEAAEINLTNLCYYDKRNPDCSADDEEIESHKKSLLKKNKTCACDNCFYGRTKLTEQLIRQAERMYSYEDMKSFGDWCRNGLLNTEYGVEKLDKHLEQWKQFKKK